MVKRFSEITQTEYNQLADAYFKKIGDKTVNKEKLSFEFFAYIYKQLEKNLQNKFSKINLRLVRMLPDPKRGNEIYYKAASTKDAFEFSLVPELLNFTHLMEDVRFINPQRSRDVPDIKIIDPEYLEQKIEEVAEQAFQKFLSLTDNKKITESNMHYEQTRTNLQDKFTS